MLQAFNLLKFDWYLQSSQTPLTDCFTLTGSLEGNLKQHRALQKLFEKSGYKHNLVFQATKTEKSRNRKRNITWFNSPLATTFRPM